MCLIHSFSSFSTSEIHFFLQTEMANLIVNTSLSQISQCCLARARVSSAVCIQAHPRMALNLIWSVCVQKGVPSFEATVTRCWIRPKAFVSSQKSDTTPLSDTLTPDLKIQPLQYNINYIKAAGLFINL